MKSSLSKAGLAALCLTSVLSAAAAFTDEATSSASRTQEAAVVASVTDGDTLRLRDGRRVRLLQIDTPELGSRECYSRAARTALLGLAPPGKPIVLESDPALDRVDRYGRLLRYVKRNGVNVNLELVRRGAAAPYFYRGERGRYAALTHANGAGGESCEARAVESVSLDSARPERAVETGASGPPKTTPPPSGNCDPNYAGGCVPPPPPDLDCADIRAMGIAPVRVVGSDPHRLDGDHDGLGCE